MWIKQALTYDIAPDPCSRFRKARVRGPSDLGDVAIRAPLETLAHDWLDPPAPFAGVKQRVKVGIRDIDRLKVSLAETGFFRPTPSGLDLKSDDFP